MKRKDVIASIAFKSVNLAFIIAGVLCSYFFGFTGGTASFLYFTTQSNIWVGIVTIYLLVRIILNLKKNNFELKKWEHILYLVVTVSITLTGFTYCFILAPAALIKPFGLDLKPIMIIPAAILHVIVPFLTVIDFLLYTRTSKISYINILYTLIPPFYYLFFSMIGYYNNFDFGKGKNYPYFFLNYGSPAGYFGFSNEAPYYFGSFYWFIILLLLISFIGFIYIYVINRRNKKRIE